MTDRQPSREREREKESVERWITRERAKKIEPV